MIESIKTLMKDLYDSFEYVRERLNPSNLIEFDEIWLKKDENILKCLVYNKIPIKNPL